MAEEFEFCDMSDASFWGVDLSRATFRDVDMTGVTISHVRMVDVDIDGFAEHITINGVDVTGYVNDHDPWYPLRSTLRPSDPEGLRAAVQALAAAWKETVERAARLTDAQHHESIGGEWSFVDTLRHLVFCTDKWFTVPILGDATFDPAGLPNSGSADFGWPGLDPDAAPTLGEVLGARDRQAQRLLTFLDAVTPEQLTRDIEVLENGTVPMKDCLCAVFEEEFEHLRYAVRDLARIE